MKSLFIHHRQGRHPPGGDLIVQLRTYDEETAARALSIMFDAVPEGYVIVGHMIVGREKRDGTSRGRRRYVSMQLRRVTGARGLTIAQWRELFAPSWEASRRPASVPASPQTCERPSAPKTTARS